MVSSITVDARIDRGIYPNLSRCQYQVKLSQKQQRITPRRGARPSSSSAERLREEEATQLICWPSTLRP